MIQEQLFTALSTVAGGRVFPNVAPNNVTRPYVVYARVASTPENTLADGAPVENTRFQIDCFDATYAAAVALAEAVKTAMKASSLTNLLLLEQDQFEPDALLHRVILDFSVWHY
ncbi:MAG: DUF3168 domain-containing protein [Betaproteobacteria bacterium]|nr:DUF3168 domain-containing protein [Betaproteobacteria bacterium]NDE55212.1 DUF3168 domain-containing protein [Actinomycetota bacterium]